MKQGPADANKRTTGDPASPEEFQSALKGDFPPQSWSGPFRALWWDARGDWESAHGIAQDLTSSWGSWMHAYLHRKEGDLWNAGYWYRRAGVGERVDSLKAEFKALLAELLNADGNTV